MGWGITELKADQKTKKWKNFGCMQMQPQFHFVYHPGCMYNLAWRNRMQSEIRYRYLLKFQTDRKFVSLSQGCQLIASKHVTFIYQNVYVRFSLLLYKKFGQYFGKLCNKLFTCVMWTTHARKPAKIRNLQLKPSLKARMGHTL